MEDSAEMDARGRLRALHERGMELLGIADLDWLGERILQELSQLTDAQSAALWLADERGELRLRAHRGLTSAGELPPTLASEGLGAGEGAAPWVAAEDAEGRAALLFVPLYASGERMGLVRLSDPLAGGFRPERLEPAALLGNFGGMALRHCKRVLALQRSGLRDRESAAYNLSYFTDYASKEIYKARRYGRVFSLLTFSIDSMPGLRHRLGSEELRRVPKVFIRVLHRLTRDADVLAKASETEFYLLLPETDFFGATMFLRRAFDALREDADIQELEARLPLSIVAGAAAFPRDGGDFDELLVRCRRRMEARRLSLQRRLHLDGLSFWEQVELLIGSPGSPKLPHEERAEPSRRGKVHPSLFDELQAQVARELLREPGERGVVYLGGPEARAGLPLVGALESAPAEFVPRVYVLGRRSDLESHPVVTPVFIEGDERLGRSQFLLWLSESASYALVQRVGLGAGWAFHTSDPAVVDGLVARLQAAYDLQTY